MFIKWTGLIKWILQSKSDLLLDWPLLRDSFLIFWKHSASQLGKIFLSVLVRKTRGLALVCVNNCFGLWFGEGHWWFYQNVVCPQPLASETWRLGGCLALCAAKCAEQTWWIYLRLQYVALNLWAMEPRTYWKLLGERQPRVLWLDHSEKLDTHPPKSVPASPGLAQGFL